MFLDIQELEDREYYKKMLQILGSLSKLFSNSNKPYLYYRATENLFCKAFDAKNLSRGDLAIDASKGKFGIGIKTFTDKNGRALEKIAEFNKDHDLFASLEAKEMVKKISLLRNARIEAAKRICDVEEVLYHCIVRKAGAIYVFEEPMSLIDVENIREVKLNSSAHSITFTDGVGKYSFYIPKSTLFKYFDTQNVILESKVNIIDDPFEVISSLLVRHDKEGLLFTAIEVGEHIFLPLYSTRNGEVAERSGLNQWNARGRARTANEVYIPVPRLIHKNYPNFFPPRDVGFNLYLPNNKKISASICQDNSKALMSNPNSDLGEWILRNILKLKEGQLVTRSILEKLGLDSVVVYKIDEKNYSINFTKLGSYEEFEQGITNEVDE